MSDYFSPYSPPDSGLDPYANPGGWGFGPLVTPEAQRAGRRAAIIMFILAGVAFGCAALFFMAWMMPLDQMPPEQLQAMQNLAAQSGLPLKAYFLAGGVASTIPGLVYGILAIWVRGGRRPAIFATMVGNAIFLAILFLSLLTAIANHQAVGIGAMLMPGILAATMIFLMTRLAVAAKAARMAKSMSAQYWQQHFEPDGGYESQQAAPPPNENEL